VCVCVRVLYEGTATVGLIDMNARITVCVDVCVCVCVLYVDAAT